MEDIQLSSLQPLTQDIQGMRILLYGFSGVGFPAGNGVHEAMAILPRVGLKTFYTHQNDPELYDKLATSYDITLIMNTRIDALLKAPERLWKCSSRCVLWFWDLRPGSIVAPLRGRVNYAFLTFNGPWKGSNGTYYDPRQWSEQLACPIGYAPQASPLCIPRREKNAPRVLFVGDLTNRKYHQGRAKLCRTLGAVVLNKRTRSSRLAIEARLPAIYPSVRYCLSTSPLAPGYTSVRTYTILACGGLLLLQRFPGCERLFIDGKNAVIFDNVTKAKRKMAELDGNLITRLRIATAGRELHARNHTVAHRVVTICREVLL